MISVRFYQNGPLYLPYDRYVSVYRYTHVYVCMCVCVYMCICTYAGCPSKIEPSYQDGPQAIRLQGPLICPEKGLDVELRSNSPFWYDFLGGGGHKDAAALKARLLPFLHC